MTVREIAKKTETPSVLMSLRIVSYVVLVHMHIQQRTHSICVDCIIIADELVSRLLVFRALVNGDNKFNEIVPKCTCHIHKAIGFSHSRGDITQY